MDLEIIFNATLSPATAATQAMAHHYNTNISSAAASSASVSALAWTSTAAPPAFYTIAEATTTTRSETNGGGLMFDTIPSLKAISKSYESVHGIVSLVTCALGIPMNCLNIWVLTRRHMRTPINFLLTQLAVFDLLTMMSYVPFSIHFYLMYGPRTFAPEMYSLEWMTFMMFHGGFTVTTHTISSWLGVALAMFRYKHIFSPAKGHITRARRLIRARIAVFVVVVASIVIMIPNHLTNRIHPVNATIPTQINNTTSINKTITMYLMEDQKLATPEMKPLTMINLWIHCIIAKLLPCILMVIFSALLVRTVRQSVRMIERRRTHMSGISSKPSESYCGGIRYSVTDNSTDNSGDFSSRRGSKSPNAKRSTSSTKSKRKRSKYKDSLKQRENGDCKGQGQWLLASSEVTKPRSLENVYVKHSPSPNMSDPTFRRVGSPQSSCKSLKDLRGENQQHMLNGLSNEENEGCHLRIPGPEPSSEAHSHDSGVHSNGSHDHNDHLTYKQQCQINLHHLQHNQHHRLQHNGVGHHTQGKINNNNTHVTECANGEPKLALNQTSGGGLSNNIIYPNLTKAESLPIVRSASAIEPGLGSRSRNQSVDPGTHTPTNGAVKVLTTSRSQDSARTTRMLLVVIILILITELPQAVLIALTVTIPGFGKAVYFPLGDIMDQLALVNNGINFLLYCIMSRDFRTTLLDLLRMPRWCHLSRRSSPDATPMGRRDKYDTCSTRKNHKQKERIKINDV